ncbi:hypothetical protein BKH43_01500 [Helicobacter sp. 13S00401-1]|uniref:hypothetical protein n=1 Tax=Helicobacter sp. 13S00401-1 TaxID=1905758 RepID=UPI000BA6C478|nr:hypothetical protein [Helicobacter sp. 13S00401-1]PAF51341.1 hypothetical protein BKH43_01500 [Helicobacter sp. 13S00401-1]
MIPQTNATLNTSTLSLLNALSKLSPKELNTTLPTLLKILSQTSNNSYQIQLGKLILETKSDVPLELGKTYWANVSQNKLGGLNITNLIAQPKTLEALANFALKLDSKGLEELFKNEHHKDKSMESNYKDLLLDKLPLVNSKQEFLELAQMLLGLQKGVISLVIKDEEKDSLLQIKKQKVKLEFYALFSSLGEIDGMVYVDSKKDLSLSMNVMSKKIKTFLASKLDTLKGFSKVDINIKPARMLFDLSPRSDLKMLDIKI